MFRFAKWAFLAESQWGILQIYLMGWLADTRRRAWATSMSTFLPQLWTCWRYRQTGQTTSTRLIRISLWRSHCWPSYTTAHAQVAKWTLRFFLHQSEETICPDSVRLFSELILLAFFKCMCVWMVNKHNLHNSICCSLLFHVSLWNRMSVQCWEV